jgi:hypothetical protein
MVENIRQDGVDRAFVEIRINRRSPSPDLRRAPPRWFGENVLPAIRKIIPGDRRADMLSRIRRVASATRSGSSISSASGYAGDRAKAAGPVTIRDQMWPSPCSQWFGQRALQTVWSFSSFSNARVRAKLALVGNVVRSHSGNQGQARRQQDLPRIPSPSAQMLPAIGPTAGSPNLNHRERNG